MKTQLGSGFGFGSVCIMQSLGPDDRKTGEELCRFLEGIEGSDGRVEFVDLKTRTEFLEYLGSVRERLENTGQVPVLHIEAHGCAQGICLASGDFVEWSELKRPLTEINVLSRLNLFVAMSACWGEWLVRMLRVTDPAPIWGCLGARKAISEDALIDGFKIFYRELLKNSDLRTAVESMGGGMYYEQRSFVLWPTEYFFLAAYRAYLLTECNEVALARRVDRLLQRRVESPCGALEEADEIRAVLRRDLANHEQWFARYRKVFFMEDLYPDHRNRFDVSFSTMMESPSEGGA